MRRMLLISRIAVLVLLAALAISFFVSPMPDWAVRVIGVTMMAAVFTLTFATVRLRKTK